jgi:hypothetical protein
MRTPVTVKRGWVPPGFLAWVPRKRTLVISHGVILPDKYLARLLRHVDQAESTRVWWLEYALKRRRYRADARKAETEPYYRAWAADIQDSLAEEDDW